MQLKSLPAKLEWEGLVTSVQPRIRLTRSFDERSHSYLGYSLRIDGHIDAEARTFWLGIGKSAQAKNQFRVGMRAKGQAHSVADGRTDTVDFYKVTGLVIIETPHEPDRSGPPWHGVPPELEVYRHRGHRRLSSRTFEAKCDTCIWGCKMPVIVIPDQWNPGRRQHRVETFCYGPKSCACYAPGPTRKVPGRSGMSWEEEDWVDEDATSHRGPHD